MSARSASARKKIETKTKANKAAASTHSRSRLGHQVPDHYYDHYPPYQGGGGGGTYPLDRGSRMIPPSQDGSMSLSGASNGSSNSGRSERGAGDGGGIERSGLRTMVENRSDGLRRGLAKTFAFNKKKDQIDATDRSESVATVRQGPPPPLGLDTEIYDFDEYHHSASPAPAPVVGQRHLRPQPYPGFHHPSPHQPYPAAPQEPPDAAWPGPPPTTKLPPVPKGSGPTLRRFLGGGKPTTRWNRLGRDPELWDPHGDVLVYLGHKENGDLPNLRLPSHVIEATRKRFLVTQLREGFIEDADMPRSPSAYWGQSGPHPISDAEDALDGGVSYEMCFPPPPSNSRTELVQHQVTSRNLFALIFHKSLVGTSLLQALTDLHARLERYRSPGEPDATAQVTSYISARGLDDVRGQPDAAISMLAWAERPGGQWARGWREAFIHCVGMHSRGLERCSDWKHVAPLTKALLERSWLEMRLRVQAAEERLAEFSFGDIWTGSSPGSGSSAPVASPQAAAERLRNFLISHYGQAYGSWPPSGSASGDSRGKGQMVEEDEEGEPMWLTRGVARALQHDFGALYDYLVDRDVKWDVSEARAGRKWEMESKSGNQAFEADTADMPMTDIIVEFDNRLRVPHVPHPFPLLPESIPQQVMPGGGGMFKSSSQPQSQKHSGRERRVALAYTESTNLDALESSYTPSSLVDAFTRFEKSDCTGEVDPRSARKGRWVLIYGILQVLAAVGVDAPGIKYREDVPYHLSAKVKKPSWTRETSLFADVRHEMSHCWTAPQSWTLLESEEEMYPEQEEQLSPGMLLSPPAMAMSASASETASSVRTSSSAGAYAYRRGGGHDTLDLPLRQRDGSGNLRTSTVSRSGSSLGSLLALDDPRKRGGKATEEYLEGPLLSRDLAPLIRDFDEEP